MQCEACITRSRFWDHMSAAIMIFETCPKFTLVKLDVRPSVVASELRVSFCLVIQMHAGNIEITPKYSIRILISILITVNVSKFILNCILFRFVWKGDSYVNASMTTLDGVSIV